MPAHAKAEPMPSSKMGAPSKKDVALKKASLSDLKALIAERQRALTTKLCPGANGVSCTTRIDKKDARCQRCALEARKRTCKDCPTVFLPKKLSDTRCEPCSHAHEAERIRRLTMQQCMGHADHVCDEWVKKPLRRCTSCHHETLHIICEEEGCGNRFIPERPFYTRCPICQAERERLLRSLETLELLEVEGLPCANCGQLHLISPNFKGEPETSQCPKCLEEREALKVPCIECETLHYSKPEFLHRSYCKECRDKYRHEKQLADHEGTTVISPEALSPLSRYKTPEQREAMKLKEERRQKRQADERAAQALKHGVGIRGKTENTGNGTSKKSKQKQRKQKKRE